MRFKIGDRVKIGPRTGCGCPSQVLAPLTITCLRPVKPFARISNCAQCGFKCEIPKGTIIAELDHNRERAPAYRLIMVRSTADLRVLL